MSDQEPKQKWKIVPTEEHTDHEIRTVLNEFGITGQHIRGRFGPGYFEVSCTESQRDTLQSQGLVVQVINV